MAERRREGSNRHGFGGAFGSREEAVRRIRLAVMALVLIIVVGTFGFVFLEGWSFIDALFMTVISVSTTGYGEVNRLDTSGRWWEMILIIAGVTAFGYATTSLVALAVEGAVRGYFRERRMRTEIDRITGHYILCGFGRVGRQVAQEFTTDGIPFVVVDQEPLG